MDERARGSKRFKASNGLEVVSHKMPSIITKGTIYIRGYSQLHDDNITATKLSSHDEAIKYRNKVIAALKEWSEKAPCFQDTPTSNESHTTCSVYKF